MCVWLNLFTRDEIRILLENIKTTILSLLIFILDDMHYISLYKQWEKLKIIVYNNCVIPTNKIIFIFVLKACWTFLTIPAVLLNKNMMEFQTTHEITCRTSLNVISLMSPVLKPKYCYYVSTYCNVLILDNDTG